MSEQGRLFDLSSPDCPPCQHGSPTSVAAAEAIRPHLGAAQKVVLDFIRSKGEHGATDEEIADGLCMSPSTSRPRRIELVAKGLVADSGKTRETKALRHAVVWVVTLPKST